MSLATRCTECGTVFRVVQDQLKVSEGWVRCGRCSAVFNAQAGLFDLDKVAPAALAGQLTGPSPSVVVQPTHQPASSAAAMPDPDAWSPAMPSSIETAGQRLDGAPLAASHNASVSAPVQDESSVGAIDSTMELPLKTLDPLAAAEVAADLPDWLLVAAPSAAASQARTGLSAVGSAPARSPTAAALTPDFDPTVLAPLADDLTGVRLSLSAAGALHQPLHGDVNGSIRVGHEVQIDADEAVATATFMRRGAGSGRWQRPAVRWGLLSSMLVLALALLLQAAFVWRDTLAAHVPALRPLFLALCEPLHCQISPLRRIEQLSVESSGLSRIEGAPLHRLSVTLRNRAEIALLAPALDLTVTDTQGKLVARKTLLLNELGVSASSIEAGAELALQALLDTGERRVSGYTVELYYP